jgi:pyridoxamine 5'-phosphate oxidase
MNLADLRKDYTLASFDEKDLESSPIAQLQKWLTEALNAEVNEPTAMNIATVNADGQPSSRIVLLKGIEDGILKFFTNYDSKKGSDLSQNNKIAVNFFWPELERQVRIQGVVKKLSSSESDLYFYSRPLESQAGANASPQSQVIASRISLEQQFKEIFNHELKQITRPIHWGGYGITPFYFEFWQGRASRLHDRLIYLPQENNWEIKRLAP